MKAVELQVLLKTMTRTTCSCFCIVLFTAFTLLASLFAQDACICISNCTNTDGEIWTTMH